MSVWLCLATTEVLSDRESGLITSPRKQQPFFRARTQRMGMFALCQVERPGQGGQALFKRELLKPFCLMKR